LAGQTPELPPAYDLLYAMLTAITQEKIALLEGDTRDDPAGCGLVNATLIAKKFWKRYEELELRGSVYNLFDKDWIMPQTPLLPNDLPMPGINFLVEVRGKF